MLQGGMKVLVIPRQVLGISVQGNPGLSVRGMFNTQEKFFSR